MSGTKRTTRARPCPACGDTKARCAIHDGGNRLWCRSILDKHSPLLGDKWRFGRVLTGGPGGSVVFRIDADEEHGAPKSRAKRQRDKKREEKQQTKKVDNEVARFRAYEELRHTKYKALVAGRSLSEKDKADLVERGIKQDELPALEELGMVSIEHGAVSLAAAGVPGVDDSGTYQGPTGFLIPSYRPTKDGGIQYLGMQVATCQQFRDNDGGKYLWLSLGNEAEAQRDGFALQVMAEDGSIDSTPLFSHIGGDKAEVAFLCDGALKTYVTALRQQAAAFGAPGAMFSTSMGQLRDGLRRVTGLNGRVKIAVAPDAGDPKNRLIMEQLASVANAVREMGYQIDWVDLSQEKGKGEAEDIDETDVAVEDLIEEQAFFEKLAPGIRREVRRGLRRRWECGFRPMKNSDQLEPQLSVNNPILYKKGQRTQKLAELLEKGHRTIVDTSGTGAGKSYWWSHLDQDDLARLGVDQVLVLSERYLEQAEEFDVGMIRGRQAQGVKRTAEGRLFKIQFGEELGPDEFQEHPSNCTRGGELDKFEKRNMALSLGSLCTKCEFKETCETNPTGYRYQRASALLDPVVTMHPKSLMEQHVMQQKDEEEGGIAIPKTGVVLDDVAMEQLLETVTVNELSALASLEPLIERLGNTEGLRALKNAVGGDKTLNPRELKALCFQQIQMEMPRSGWAGFVEEEEFIVGKSDGRLELRCWLSYLKEWVNGNAVAYVADGNLVFKTFNDRLRSALANAAWVLFLDATASPLVLEKLLGERPEMIAEERWLTPADLKISQIKGLGILGYRRNAQQEFQVKVALGKMKKAGLLPYESTAIVDTKKGLAISSDYGVVTMAYLSDSRGSNRAFDAGCSTLAMIGSPNTNLGNAAATYELLFGESVDLGAQRPVTYPVLQEDGSEPMVCCEVGSQHEGFSRFYAHLRRAELLQALGRLRHNIRANEVLNVIVLGDTVMPFPVRLVELAEIIDDDNMADWHSCNDKTLGEAAWSLKNNNKPITVEAIAEATGLHPTLVGEWIEAFGPGWMPGAAEQKAREEAAAQRQFASSRRRRRTGYPRRGRHRLTA